MTIPDVNSPGGWLHDLYGLLSARTPVGAHATVSSLSSSQTITIPTGASGIWLECFTQNIRVRYDGDAPTASAGFQITPAMGTVFIPAAAGAVIKVIEETASASLQYQAVG